MEYGQNIFTAIIGEDGTIYEATTGRKRQPVGVDIQREQELLKQIGEMQDVIDNYYGKLVELGAIVPPKSAEDIAREQAAQQALINERLLEAISGLQAELGAIKHGDLRRSDESGDEPIGQNRPSNRKAGRPSKGRDTAGGEDAPGDPE